MNDLNVVVKNGVNLFSSRLIAEATGKEHSNVVRDIKNMLEGLGLYDFHPSILKDDDFKGFFINCKDYQGRKVVDEILLDKQLTMCLVTGYDVKQRMRVIKRVDELEERIKQLAAPQQQTQLIPGTPEHFNKCFTECFTQAYSSYFGKPAQTALTDQQQHTEPVKALPLVHQPCPGDEISLNKCSERFITNINVLKKMVELFGLESRMHDPVCVEGKPHMKQNPYPVFKKVEILSIVRALQYLGKPIGENNGKEQCRIVFTNGRKRDFTIIKMVDPADYDGKLFDSAVAFLRLYLKP